MAFSPKLLQQGAAGVPVIPKNYIEDVFNTNLYTGTGATQTITNGIDLSTNGGLVWSKARGAASHALSDTINGVNKYLSSDVASAISSGFGVTAFNTTGFNSPAFANGSSPVSWTFRKQPKFFDMVTFIATSGKDQRISHSLGSVPGCIIIKPINTAGGWYVYHRSLSGVGASAYQNYLALESTAAAGSSALTNRYWGSSNPTSTTFGVSDELLYDGGTDASRTYIAYIFAHDAGGFGLTGNDNVISCGSYAGNATVGNSVTLGYEPQWLMVKPSSRTGDWIIVDNIRSFSETSNKQLFANSSSTEDAPLFFTPTATGFKLQTTSVYANGSGETYIYVAIRRGPMKVPTDATKVFTPSYGLNAGANGQAWNAGFPVDMYIRANPTAVDFYTSDRLRGPLNYLLIDSTAAESTVAFSDRLDNNIGVFSTNAYDYRTWIGWQFRRASSFFDEVCYTGTEVSGQTFNHNLGAVPEMMIVKARDGTTDWTAYHSALGASARIYPNATNAAGTGTAAPWNSTAPTSTVFSLGNAGATNLSGTKFVNYLFATCAGVSKVGSYTGTATTLQIDCGFTTGARFVLIKRTDSTGDWYVWDSARGIIAGNDPYLLLNSSTSEVTNTDYIDTYSPGFELSSTAPAAINASGGTFIFLAIA